MANLTNPLDQRTLACMALASPGQGLYETPPLSSLFPLAWYTFPMSQPPFCLVARTLQVCGSHETLHELFHCIESFQHERFWDLLSPTKATCPLPSSDQPSPRHLPMQSLRRSLPAFSLSLVCVYHSALTSCWNCLFMRLSPHEAAYSSRVGNHIFLSVYPWYLVNICEMHVDWKSQRINSAWLLTLRHCTMLHQWLWCCELYF